MMTEVKGDQGNNVFEKKKEKGGRESGNGINLYSQFPMSPLQWAALFKFLREVWNQHDSGVGMMHPVGRLQQDNNT